MGGRGTYSIGNNVSYTYKTVKKISGIKVLEGISNKHGLPEESHSSTKYIKLDFDGSVKQIRLYNKDHTSKADIEFSTHNGHKIFHAHDYLNGVRGEKRDLSTSELKKYSKYFGGKI